jgi:hypothetical protein
MNRLLIIVPSCPKYFADVQSVRLVSSWALAKLPTSSSRTPQVAADGEDDRAKEPLSFWLKLALNLNLLVLSIPGFMLIVGFDWLDVRRARFRCQSSIS